MKALPRLLWASGKPGSRNTARWQCGKACAGLAEIQQKLAEVGLSGGKIRVNRHGTAEVVEGLVFLIQTAQRRAQVDVACRIVGPQLEGGSERLRRFAVATQGLERSPRLL